MGLRGVEKLDIPRRMSVAVHRAFTWLLLLLMANSLVLPLIAAIASQSDDDVVAACVLTEVLEEGASDESGDFALQVPTELPAPALAVTYTAHIAEECEFYRAQQRRAHPWHAPPCA